MVKQWEEKNQPHFQYVNVKGHVGIWQCLNFNPFGFDHILCGALLLFRNLHFFMDGIWKKSIFNLASKRPSVGQRHTKLLQDSINRLHYTSEMLQNLDANFKFKFQNTSNVSKKNAPSKAHSAKPKDLHFLRLKFVSALLMPCSRLRLCPSGCSTPCKVWINMEAASHPKITEFKRENWLIEQDSQGNRLFIIVHFLDSSWLFIFFPKGLMTDSPIHIDIKKNLDFQNFHQSEPLTNWFLRKECLSHKKHGVFLPRDALKNHIFAPPKKTHQDLWPPKPIYKAQAMGNNSNFFGGGIRPF